MIIIPIDKLHTMKNLNTCCCLSSRSGAMLLGLLGIAVGSFAVIVFSTGFGAKTSVYTALSQKVDETIEKFDGGELSDKNAEYVIKLYKNIRVFYPQILGTGLTFGVLYLFINVLMLVGVVKSKPWLILPWLVMTMVCLISQTTGALCYAIYIAFHGRLSDALIYFLLYCPILVLGLYLWLVVYSVQGDIKKQKIIVYDLRPMETNNAISGGENVPKDDPPPPYKE